jgi:hypothetical protein
MKTDLHFSEIGQGEPIMFIHGGFDPAEETLGDSRSSPTNTALFWSTDVAMGESPASDRLDFDAHAEHTMRVVGEGAHLVRRPTVSPGGGRAPASGVDANRD